MSYILDALRKAERDRQVSRVPTLATAHGGAEPGRRLQWAWAVTGPLVVSAVVAYSLFWASGRPDPRREAALPPPAGAGPASSSARVDFVPAPPALERTPEGEPAVAARAPGLVVERPPGHGAPARPYVAPAAPPATTPPADLQGAPAAARPSDAPETRRAAADPRPVARPAVPVEGASPGPQPGDEPVAQSAVAPAPLPDAGAGRAAQPAPAQPLPRLTLDVLVYSDVPAERLVFISGRKYVEGQTLDGETVVEQITPDGAVLQHQGKRIVLRPKLNPYTRPGSP